MAQVQGGRIGPSGVGSAAYENKVDVDQAITWYAHGARQGVLSGLTYAGVAGQMALDFAAGAALISRRDASRNVQDMGYLLRNNTTTRVTFGVASASARNDAVVAAVVDTTDGVVGTGALANGGHLVVVPGVSGTTTVRTDTDIQTWLGRGGWVRLLDVPVASGATQINTGTVVDAAATAGEYLYKANTLAVTAGTGWTLTSARYIHTRPGFVWVEIVLVRSGADIVLDNNIGNLSDYALTSAIPTALRPTGSYALIEADRMDVTFGRVRITTGGVPTLVSGAGDSGATWIFTSQTVAVHGEYFLL